MYPMADPLDSHTADVAAIGITPPELWSQLLARYEGVRQPRRTPSHSRTPRRRRDRRHRRDVATLRALALAEASAMPPAHAEVDHVVRAAVLNRLRELYAPHAAPNYQQVGADFDSLAHKFTAAAGLVDPETPAVDMVSASEKTRKAWGDACPRHAPIDSERSQPV